jgi:hypothetical protein
MEKIKGVNIGDDVELFKKLIGSDLRLVVHFKYLPQTKDETPEEIVYHFERYGDTATPLIRCVQITSRLPDPFRLGGVCVILQELDFMLVKPSFGTPVFLKGDKYYERAFIEVFPKGWQDFYDRDVGKIEELEASLKSVAPVSSKQIPLGGPRTAPPGGAQPKNGLQRDNDLQRIKELESFLLSEIKEDDTSS